MNSISRKLTLGLIVTLLAFSQLFATIGIFESEVFSINTNWEINQPELLIQRIFPLKIS